MNWVLAIDVGTSGLKTGRVDLTGAVSHIAHREQIFLDTADPDVVEHDPDALRQNLISACRETIGANAANVAAVSVTSYQYGLVLLDHQLHPIGGISTMLDSRSRHSFPAFLDQFDTDALYQQTGGPAFAQAILPRLFDLNKRNPELPQQTAHVLSSKAWLLYQLTGEVVSEISTESATQCIDIHQRQWAPQLIAQTGFSITQFPKLIPATHDALTLQPAAAEQLGLSRDCPVIPGVYDGGALAAGLAGLTPQNAICNIGTSAMLRRISHAPLLSDQSSAIQLQPFCFLDEQFLVGGATNNAAINLAWLPQIFPDITPAKANQLAQSPPPGSNSIVYLPYLTGERDPRIGEHGSAAFLGLRRHHTQADMIRAVFEGVSLRLSLIQQAMQASNVHYDQVMAAGGGITRSTFWPQLLADVLNHPVALPEAPEPALVGTALIAFTATGHFANTTEATDHMIRIGKRYQPDDQSYAIYAALCDRYRQLNLAMSPIFPILSQNNA